MMPSNFRSLDGQTLQFDLDTVVDVVDGWSKIRPNWQGFIVYIPSDGRFIELMSALPDVRGNSEGEAVEVDAEYVQSVYGLTEVHISELRRNPSGWSFLTTR